MASTSSTEPLIQLSLDLNVLLFGSFTLKSGRTSPYFFNAGLLYTGKALQLLAESFADAIQASGAEFDVLFGPAYKGISLAAITAVELARRGINCEFAYNRKEAKDHGEGGSLVGAPLEGKRVFILDDVITAGTAIREVIDIIQANKGNLVGVAVSLDRQERGQKETSAVQDLESQYGIKVQSAMNLNQIIHWLEKQPGREQVLADMKKCMSHGATLW